MKRLLSVLAIALTAVLLTAANSGRSFSANLTGDAEVPSVVTDTTGRVTFKANAVETEIRFKMQIRHADDILAVAGAHIHCGAEDENGPAVAFLAGAVPPAGFDGKVTVVATLTDASILPTECGSNIAELLDAIRAGNTYVNVHSAANPGGEVRGQIG